MVDNSKTSDSARIEVQKKVFKMANADRTEEASAANDIRVMINGKYYDAKAGIKIL